MTKTLIVIDVQNEYFDGGLVPLWEAEVTERRIIDAIELTRAHGGHVVLIRHESNADSGLFAKGSDGSQIRSAIREAAGDAPVVTKGVADAFQDTDLDDHLTEGGDLLICGMMTQNCVVFTAMSQCAAKYRVRVIGDLCTAPSEFVHKIALNALGSKLTVSTLKEVAWGAARSA